MQIRELYCPAHFGNTYEVAMPYEMEDILGEARFWGFNRYSDWFDTIDLYNLYDRKGSLYNLPEAMWDHKFGTFRVAADLGYELGLVITPNHVFSDQVTEANRAVTDEHIFGQLVCPAKPGVSEMIVENYQRLFADFARRGLKLSAISLGAYDYGGCLCEACQPWIVTFGKLALQIAEAARQHFGQLDVDLWGWWWTDADHEQFSSWADAEAPDTFRGFAHYIPYGQSAYQPRRIPASARERAFVHIGYGEQRGIDVYGHFGPTVAPARIEATVASLRERKAEGFLAYSEGFFDDVNKALLAGLASGQFATADELLRAYAARHFGGDLDGWVDFLRDFGDIDSADPVVMRSRWVRLASGVEPHWRLRQWEGKLQMLEAHAAGLIATEPDARRAAVKRFRDSKCKLWRDVWKRGLQRHIFRFDCFLPPWYYEAVAAESATTNPDVGEEA